jgi:hypothetical protein
MPDEDSIRIKTKDSALTPKRFREILYLLRFAKTEAKSLISTGVVIILATPFTIRLVFPGSLMSAAIGFLIVLIVYTQVVFYPLFAMRRYVTSPENGIFFVARYYVFDEEKIHVYMHDDTLSTTRLDSLIKIIRTQEYFLLFVAKSLFHYLPLDAFETEEDLARFEALLQSHKIPIKQKDEPIQTSLLYARRNSRPANPLR